jgi:hypothetical protein
MRKLTRGKPTVTVGITDNLGNMASKTMTVWK